MAHTHQAQTPVAVLAANRTPFARAFGAYQDADNLQLLSHALDGLVARTNLQGVQLGEVVAGAVLANPQTLNLTREAVLSSQLAPTTPAYDMAQACGTGLQAIFASANKIALGIIDSAIAGGVDSASNAPILLSDSVRRALVNMQNSKSFAQKVHALRHLSTDLISLPKNREARTNLSMGDHQAITTAQFGITRQAQDQLSFDSHKNLLNAYENGFFSDLITPFMGLDKDNIARTPDMAKLASLKPVFGKGQKNPTMTAGNSSALTDGAALVLLGNDDFAYKHNLTPQAYLQAQITYAADFIGKNGMAEGLLMAPAHAVPQMLRQHNLTLQDFDFYEIHEAFAGQVLSTLSAWESAEFGAQYGDIVGTIDHNKLNVTGSSLATGHPFAATGARIVATATKLLAQKGQGRALISICAAGGQGVACILQR